MSDFDRAFGASAAAPLAAPFAAPLARALYLDEYGEPLAIAAAAAIGGEIPARALYADLGDGTDEASAAAAVRSALADWKAARARSGAAELEMPGCVALRARGERSLYWPGSTLDLARRRAESRDDSPVPRPSIAAFPPLSSLGRSGVARGRIALVTGGAQGFGEEITRGLAASGALVFIADVNLAGARKLASELNEAAGRTAAIAVGVDVSDEASVEAAFAFAAGTAGGIDLAVSNAGILNASSVLDQDLTAFKKVTDVNYTGFLLVAKHAGRVMRRQARVAPRWRSDIIQINSKSGLEGSNRNGAYAGSKFGGIGLVQSFALELVEWGIKVNAICPGNFFDGPLWSDPEKGLFVQYLRSGKVPGARTVADVKAAYEAKVPMGRGCGGADVMRAIYYIVEQEYETGQALPVTGGQVMLG
jgi:sorbitol-6-phosphate 2-dehydrogenase